MDRKQWENRLLDMGTVAMLILLFYILFVGMAELKTCEKNLAEATSKPTPTQPKK